MLLTHGASAALPPVALTIGNFDGVHLGHQAMIGRLRAEAAARRLTACVLTFEPHPRELLAPAAAPARLSSLREKIELLAGHGLERVHVQRFTRAFASLSPQGFLEQVLARALKARWLVVGEDFRFGAGRAGDLALLARLAPQLGCEVATMPTIAHGGVRVSSSAVRNALARGDLPAAARLLGRPYSMSGRVVHGDKLGRDLGYATANVDFRRNRPPLSGIFAVRVHGAGARPLPGVASLGVRPTVTSSGRAVLEAHVFDFSADLYRRHLRVEFLHKIRDEEKFDDLEALRRQIELDCAAAKSLLSHD